jgi:hypothetical protein
MEALAEEAEAVASIFGEGIAVRESESGVFQIALQGLAGGVSASLEVRAESYPSSTPPFFCELEGMRRSEAAALLSEVKALGQGLLGRPMLFELLNLLRDRLGVTGKGAGGGAVEGWEGGEEVPGAVGCAEEEAPALEEGSGEACALEVYSGPHETERKSVFQAHAAAVSTLGEVRAVLQHIASQPRIARATHPVMHAYRIPCAASGAVLADNDDDGEAGAGSKLAQLLVNMGVTGGVLVVVSRWYGGVPLGPSRFGIIANIARQALLAAGLGGSKK